MHAITDDQLRLYRKIVILSNIINNFKCSNIL